MSLIAQIVLGIFLYLGIVWVVKINHGDTLQNVSRGHRTVSYSTCWLFWMVILLLVGSVLTLIPWAWTNWLGQAIFWPRLLFAA